MKWLVLGIQLQRWSSEILSGHSFWEWLDRALQVFILCYEEWSCWSKFQASKKSSLDFCFQKRPASLAATKLASKKRTSPPPSLSFLDLCWWLTILVIWHLSLFSSWQTYSLCIFETVRCWDSAGIPSSLALVFLLSVRSLVVRCLRNWWISSWWISETTPLTSGAGYSIRHQTNSSFLSNITVTNTDW